MPHWDSMPDPAPTQPGMLRALPVAGPAVDLADLERRVADLEDRARREDVARASKERLEAIGFKFPKKATVL